VKDLDPGTLDHLAEKEGDMWYFPEWVDTDLPHQDIISVELGEKTLGFAVATPDGEIVQKFKKTDLTAASAARDGARVKLDVSVDLQSEEESDDEDA